MRPWSANASRGDRAGGTKPAWGVKESGEDCVVLAGLLKFAKCVCKSMVKSGLGAMGSEDCARCNVMGIFCHQLCVVQEGCNARSDCRYSSLEVERRKSSKLLSCPPRSQGRLKGQLEAEESPATKSGIDFWTTGLSSRCARGRMRASQGSWCVSGEGRGG